MIFSELYGVYYGTVAAVLKAAADHPVTRGELRGIVQKYGLGESMLTIPAALEDGRWQLLAEDGTTPLHHAPSMPLTVLEKRWLKALCADPRVRLFGDEVPDYPDVEPLFRQEDVIVFDRYADGDPYGDEAYVRRFRVILKAVRGRTPLRIGMISGRGIPVRLEVLPDHLEYSEKDDKFRLIGFTKRFGRRVTNLGRITDCTPAPESASSFEGVSAPEEPEQRAVEFELTDERNTLERVLLHFAHFHKEAEKLEEGRYRIRVAYDAEDETEMVIRILSFGPTIRVTAPESFVALIRQRLIRQKSCGL